MQDEALGRFDGFSSVGAQYCLSGRILATSPVSDLKHLRLSLIQAVVWVTKRVSKQQGNARQEKRCACAYGKVMW